MKSFWVRFGTLYIIVGLLFITFVFTGNRTVMTIARNQSINRGRVIVIDAGHGGEDGGATSCSGRLESHLNLEIALRMNDLCHLLGYETRMIRTTDESVYTEGNTIASRKASDLRERVKKVNETSDCILISIHQNTFPDGRYHGAQVFYSKTTGSMELANEVQENFAIIDPQNRRKTKEATGIYLMQHIKNTGILVECGFLSNFEEDRKLCDEAYQKMISSAIISALSKYINP
jgi:N-acetylmuramoyl-L-alanine amidase